MDFVDDLMDIHCYAFLVFFSSGTYRVSAAHISFVLYATFSDVKIMGFWGCFLLFTAMHCHFLSLISWLSFGGRWRIFMAWLSFWGAPGARQYTCKKHLSRDSNGCNPSWKG